MSTSLCLSVCLSATISPEPHSRSLIIFLCMLPMAVARSSSCRVAKSQEKGTVLGVSLLSSNTSSICHYNMVNFGRLVAEILSLVWSTPANFNGFRVLASLLQRRRSTEVNQTLHYVWPSPGLVHYIYTFGISCFLTEFCHVQNSLYVHLRTIAQVSRAISSQLRHVSTIGKTAY